MGEIDDFLLLFARISYIIPSLSVTKSARAKNPSKINGFLALAIVLRM